MKKSDWQYLVDTLLFICITGIAVIGFLLGLIIPKGPSVSESSKYLLGLHRHDWADIHFYLSISFTALLIIHLVLSWKWIKNKATKIFKKAWPTFLTLTLALALVTPLLIWTLWPKYTETYADYGLGLKGRDTAREKQNNYSFQQEGGYVVVTGQMTLTDIEKATGIPAKTIMEKLGLPKRTRPKETLGRLRKQYGFNLQDVRDIITELMAVPAKIPKNIELRTNEVAPAKIPDKQVKNKEAKTDESEHKDKLTRGRLSVDRSGILITGQMSLKDIERQTGIPARILADNLGLPSTAPLNERLGRLRRMYLFTIQDVRDVISKLLKDTGKRERI
ncbi:MAG: DUF4405 domain-containing protein [Candidatus Aminicenantes bacterium]|jgi:hypothetical protein